MYFISFNINPCKIKYALLEDAGNILEKSQSNTPTDNKENFYMEIIKIVNNYCLKYEISGICISFDGIVNSKRGIVLSSENLPILEGINLKEELEELLFIDVSVENKWKCQAYGELWQGLGREYQNILYLSIGKVVGGAIIKNKRIHHGLDYRAGEFGNMIFNSHDGKMESWNQKISLDILLKKCQNSLGNDSISLKEILDNSLEKLEVLEKELENYYFNLAIGLYNFQFLYDPEIIIINGKLCLVNNLIQKVSEKLNFIFKQNGIKKTPTLISKSEVIENSSLIGALYSFLYG